MVKAPVYLTLIFLLLLSTSGISITKHYCGKTLIQTALYSTPGKCCSGGCPGCHNEKLHIQIKDRFEAPANLFDFSALSKKINQHYYLPFLNFDGTNSQLALTQFQRAEQNPPPKTFISGLAGNRLIFLQVLLF